MKGEILPSPSWQSGKSFLTGLSTVLTGQVRPLDTHPAVGCQCPTPSLLSPLTLYPFPINLPRSHPTITSIPRCIMNKGALFNLINSIDWIPE